MKFKSIAIFLSFVCSVCAHQFNAGPVSVLDDPQLYEIPWDLSGIDPIAANAEEIRKNIDPTKSLKWSQGGFKEAYKEFILETYSSYDKFWQRIPESARRLVDLDHDGVQECCVVSRGMKTTAWGFSDFFAIFAKETCSGKDSWKLVFIHVLDDTAWIDKDMPMIITDLDRDGRPDVLFNTSFLGGSRSSSHLHTVSINPAGKYSHHTLNSSFKIGVLYPHHLRPLFTKSFYDDWRDDDCGASVAVRGVRVSYYKWLTTGGFIEQ